jgi:hypothetical protein
MTSRCNAALVVDQNPLGSAAGYGSPSLFMLYHQRIGFETLNTIRLLLK